MARKTIKILEQDLATVRELRQEDQRSYKQVLTERNSFCDRVKQIAAENETLRQDIKWLKALVQNLVNRDRGADALPR